MKIIVLNLLFTITVFCQLKLDWELVNPSNINVAISSYYQKDNSILFTSTIGRIYISNDSGKTWLIKNSNLGNTEITLFEYGNKLWYKTATEVGTIDYLTGQLIKSYNFDENIGSKFINDSSSVIMTDIYSQDMGERSYDFKVSYTTDKGMSWQTVVSDDSLIGVYNGSSVLSKDIQYLAIWERDDGVKPYNGDCHLYKTTNSGKNWTMIKNFPFEYRTVNFIDENHGLSLVDYSDNFTTSYYISVTSDGGSNWKNKIIPYGGFENISLVVNDSNIFILNNERYIYKSTDYGFNWDSIKVYPYSKNANHFSYLNNTLYLLGYAGCLMSSSDLGETWVNHRTGFLGDIIDVSIYKDSLVYVVTNRDSTFLEWSDNSGKNWNETLIDTINQQYYMFNYKDTVLLFNNTFDERSFPGIPDLMKITYDRGKNWETKKLPFSLNQEHILAVKTFDSKMWYLLLIYNNYSTRLIFTSDGGNTWSNTPTGNNATNIDMIDDSTGYASAYNQFFKTTDGGKIWTELLFPYKDNITCVKAVNKDTIFICTGEAVTLRILKSTDGGKNWTINFIDGNITKIEFFNNKEGIATNNYGRIFFTFDGGDNWTQGDSQIDNYILNGDAGYAFNSSQLFRLKNRKILAVDEKKNIIKEFLLSQNYPNPFNPLTTIEYSIPQRQNVSIKIYDILGKEVITLSNNIQEAGKHKLQFNGSRFSSGVYFYRIITGNNTATKKMILLK